MARKRAASRRANGEGSYTRTRSGVRYRVPVGQDSAGQTVMRDFYGRTEDEARQKFDAWRQANPSGPPTTDARQLLNDLLATYTEKVVRPNCAISTYEDSLSLIRSHIAPYIGRFPICSITTMQVDAWLAERYQETGHGRAVERALHIVRRALGAAVRWNILSVNVATAAMMPKFKRRKARALTLVEAQALLAAAEGRLDLRKPYKTARGEKHYPKIDTRLTPLYLLALTIGPRKGELLALRWSSLEGDTLTISASVDKRRRERGTKTDDSDRSIELDEHLVEALRAHRLRLQAEPHQEGWRPDGLMFPTTAGTIMSQRNLDRHFKSVLAAAGLPATIRFHDLRHSAATLMLAEGGQLVDVSRTLGHASAEVTRKIYAHSYKEGQRKAVAGVSKKLAHPK